MMKFLLRAAFAAFGLWLAAQVVPGITIDGAGTLAGAALLLGVVNAIVRPVLVVLTLPITILTLGLFLFVVNAMTFGLVAYFLARLPHCRFRSGASRLAARQHHQLARLGLHLQGLTSYQFPCRLRGPDAAGPRSGSLRSAEGEPRRGSTPPLRRDRLRAGEGHPANDRCCPRVAVTRAGDECRVPRDATPPTPMLSAIVYARGRGVSDHPANADAVYDRPRVGEGFTPSRVVVFNYFT